ncbi:alpha/beta hydrolase fold domain-containing protein [Pseudoxanthomonas winnipegensis]|uniref:alpha/beta hydrolase fold domain-containing protein n=1 Tax=Pseudoxanthomonas winnipegensis TaxID=2480810 RepID=UPI001040D10C|nr:alpha/beta hydrolase fold domain-containing protein [Pseudoxanthomonas winnipegensis]TBV76820.1 steryl acetyl hydrolase [Pseudoxanthomonas winnipegensis]
MNDPFASRHPDDLPLLVRQQPLAWVVSGAPGAQHATPLPVQLVCAEDGAPVTLLGHFARNNAQLAAIAADGRATVLLIGPQGYVSPSWFGDRTRAPTWNFAWALFDVQIALRDSKADADRLIGGLVEQMEAGRPAAWCAEEMGPRYHHLAQAVVGFEARVLAVRSRFKLGQDERDDVFADILRGLDITGQDDLAAWMRRFSEGRPADALPPSAPAAKPLDPEIKRFIDEVVATGRRLTAGRLLDWPQKRRIAEDSRLPWRTGGAQVARTTDTTIDTEAGPLRLRIHDPSPGVSKPTVVYLHGGGWAMFSLDTHDRVMREYAARSGMAVVGLDYALAPEAPYPAALDQVVALSRWLHTHGQTLGLDGERLALAGDSAGGNLSMGAALRLRDAGHGEVVKAVLSLYGGFSPHCSPTARQRYGTSADMLSGEETDFFWNNYIDRIDRLREPYAAPLLADLQGLPPVFVQVGECDVLVEQNLQMAGALLAVGNAVQVRVYPGAPHSFIEALAVSRLANQALDDGVAWLRQVLLGQVRSRAA